MTQSPEVVRVSDVACTVGESPVWSAAEGAWYWVDIPARKVWRLDAASGAVRNWDAPEMVACLALADDGGMIAGMESGIFRLALGNGQLAQTTLLATPGDAGPGIRFNDGRCDRQGRFWSGTMDMSAPRPNGILYRYSTRDGLSAPVADGLVTQNGLAWSPDGRTMYLSDSHASRQLIWSFDYDIDAGVPHHRRVFVDMNAQRGRPDGAAMDVDGCYWICGNDGSCLLRFTPAGKLDRLIELPLSKPSMCTFGGPDMDTLLVTSISAGAPADDALAGAVLMVRPGVTGMAETRFAT